MATFKGEQSLINFCQSLRNTAKDTSDENLIERLMFGARREAGWDDPHENLAPSPDLKIDAQRHQAVTLIKENSEGTLSTDAIEAVIDRVLLKKSV